MKKSKTAIRTSNGDRVLDTVFTIILAIYLLILIYPLVFVLSSSFSSGDAVSNGQVLLWPVNFSLEGYKLVFENKEIWRAYGNTIFYTVAGTMLSLFLTILAAYPMSRRNFQGKGFFGILFMIPMFFSGGLIPTYILATNLKIVGTRWPMILMNALNIYNMIIMRTFFQNTVPEDLYEAAKLDGSSDIQYLLRILLPLSKPVISVICMYYAVAIWNNYFTGMIYVRTQEFMPLQNILRQILNSVKIDLSTVQDPQMIAQNQYLANVMKYALVVVSTVPILTVYPFIQKYFTKGVMIGSVKG